MAGKKIYQLDAHSTVADTDVVAISLTASGDAKKETVANISTKVRGDIVSGDIPDISGDYQVVLAEGAFADGDKTKLDAIEASADVTDTTNVTSAGALMDSEVTNLAQVKAFDTTDYATAAQGALADSAQQPPSEGAFANGDKTKLDGIETGADVTDTANVTSAGALMDSEVSSLSGVKTLTVPDSTTISTFGASLVDDANAAAARTTLGVDAAGIDNSTDVTLAGTPNYLTLSGQEITLTKLDITDDTNFTAGDGIGLSTNTVSLDINGLTEEAGFTSGDFIAFYDTTAGALRKVDYDNLPSGGGGGSGDVSKVGTPVDNQIGVWTGDGTIEGDTALTFDTTTDTLTTVNIAVSGTVDGRDVATDGTKLDGIEASADVTDTTNVTAAGALMDSEVTNLAQVKAFDSSDYATAAQGATADSALQDITGENLSSLADATITAIASGELLKWNGSAWINNTLAEAGISAVGHTHTASEVTDFDTEVSNNASVAANTAKVTNATHTGDVTGDTALTIAAGAVDVAMLANGTDGELITWDAAGAPTTVAVGTSGHVLTSNGVGAAPTFQAAAGGGDVTGPASSVDNTLPRFDLTTGKLLQTSGIVVSDTDDITGVQGITASSNITAGGLYLSGYNYYQMEPRGTGVDPVLDIYGSDTNVGLNIRMQGTGTLQVDGTDVALSTDLHDAVTLAGTGTYLSLAGQQITVDPIDISDDTNLTAGTGLTLTGDTLSVDASQTQITAVGTITTGTWNGTDIAVAAGGTGSSTASGARTNLGLAIGSDVQAYDADTAKLDVAQEYTKTQNFNATTLTDGATINWDASSNQVCKVTLGGNRTMAAPTNLVDGATYILRVIQDATGSRTLTWNAVFKRPGGTAPTLTTTASGIDIISFVSDGTNLYGVASLAFA